MNKLILIPMLLLIIGWGSVGPHWKAKIGSVYIDGTANPFGECYLYKITDIKVGWIRLTCTTDSTTIHDRKVSVMFHPWKCVSYCEEE